MKNEFQIASNGYRYNPRLKPSEDIHAQIAAHKAKQAKGTVKEQIEKVLSEH